MRILVTGGAGFIGSAFIRKVIGSTAHEVGNLDKLTYAGNLDSLGESISSERYHFFQVDICEKDDVERVFETFRPTSVIHFAAESHVDRSIDGPIDFIQTNILGTFTLLEVARKYYSKLNQEDAESFRFHHVSTDEVYGDLADTNDYFTEKTPYAPSSPYSATKASSDHLVRAWYRTYGFPIVITNCSNNYGPYQFPEKLIPHMILNALAGKKLPIYGAGDQVRDWLFVEDHADALLKVLSEGKIGETYNIGGKCEKKNIEVVEALCEILDQKRPKSSGSYKDLIEFVKDRPGHDQRYAIDISKIARDLGWAPNESFESGLSKTIDWYLENESWWAKVLDGSYRLERLGGSEK